MTLRFIDGFDHHTTTTLTSYNKWGSFNNCALNNSDTHRRFTGDGQYLEMANFQSNLIKDFGSNEASGIFGMAVKVTFSGTNSYNIYPFMLYDGATPQLLVRLNSNNTISLMRNSTVIGTSTYTFPTGSWFYLEFKWKISDSISTNDVILYADGVSIINLAATTDTKNTSNAYATKLRIHGDEANFSGAAAITYYDDFYWCDLAGSVNNAALGPVRVSTLFPSGNGNSSQLVNSAGNSTNNSTYVDDATPNGDTDYVETSTPGNKDTYAATNTPASTVTIYGVAINTCAKKTDASARSFKSQMRISTTDYEGAETFLNTSYTNHQEIKEVSPATAAAFTKSEVDAAEYGSKCHA